jgi:malate permease and related proteins
MNFNLVVEQILVLFLIIFIGYIIRKKGFINEEINKGLSNILLDITLPALILFSITGTEIEKSVIFNVKVMVILSCLIYAFVIIFTNLFLKYSQIAVTKSTVFNALLVFGNVGFMGYPIIGAIYPSYGIFYAVISNIIFNIILYTYGIYIFTVDKGKEKINIKNLANNGIIAIIIGFIFILTGNKMPEIISGALESLGEMTFPLSMLIIGSSLTNVKFKAIFRDKDLYLLAFLKLLILPLLILLLIRQFALPVIICNILILLVAMPSATNVVIFAEKYDNNYNFASEGVFFTTLLSLFTIPLITRIIFLI